MALVHTPICDFGWKAKNFSARGTDGETHTLTNIRGTKGTLVVFICNHCPYVRAISNRLSDELKALQKIGIGVIAIMSNDISLSPGDSFENMKNFADAHRFNFPMSSTRATTLPATMMRCVRRIFSASMQMMNCNIADGWTNPKCNRFPAPSASYLRR